uniref:Retrotransposon protein, putative, unclassified n=1 Tax=Oryza sativa subsp. japonica TaxID=39947 RepID=Q33AB1_ORYSJ|nr:retrotransposon protein, putative, unclassified [Oryza sativa Japonica Group]
MEMDEVGGRWTFSRANEGYTSCGPVVEMSWHRAGVLLLGAQSCLPVPEVPAVGGIGSVLSSMARMGWKLCHVFRLYTVVVASGVEIKGVGSVTFTAKSGEHRLLTGVYYIPALRNSIFSVGQLDENGSRLLVEDGLMRIWDRRHHLLAKVIRGTNRLYILSAQVAQPVCLAARWDDEAWQWHERFGHLHFEALKRHSAKEMRGMPAIFWGEAVVTAVYIHNRSPTKALDGRTPYEAWHGRKPAVSHLRVFGCLAFAKELGHIGKLDDKSTPSYTEGSKAYRILDPETQRVRTVRDVVFDEGRGWVWDKAVDAGSTPTYDDFTVEYVHFEGAGGVGSSTSPSVSTPVPEPPPTPTPTHPRATTSTTTSSSPTPPQPVTPHAAAPTATPPGTSIATPARVEHSPVEFATPLSHDEERIDAYHDGEQLRYRTMEDLLGNQPMPGLVPPDLEAQLHLACDDGEHRSFAEAEKHAAWRAAMQSEMDAVQENRTWELADLPRGHRAITLKWVFKLKRDEAGAIVKHKARLVARCFVQQEGIDYDDAFAPVARMESVRLLALAAQEGWGVHQMDVKSAFLNGDLKEEVYMHQPSGFVIPGKEGKVLRLHKALYGLRQAPRAWNDKFDSTLKGMGFEQSPHEAAIYRRGNGGNALLVGVYVDDLVITGTKDAEVVTFKEEMKATFQMSDLGPLSFYLGIEVHQDDSGITLRQTAYAKRIVELAGLTDCNPALTPMEERLKLSHHSTTEEVDATQYRRLVGSLRYLTHTRPDLAFSVGYVSRFMQRPITEHQQAVKRIIHYVAGTLDHGLYYPRCPGKVHFVGYSDSDHAGDIDNSKSTSGILFFLSECLVSWQSVKQQVVALSSCEAEYMATSAASTQALWLARLLSDLLGRDTGAVELRVDSKSALALAKNPVFHERSKHIRVRIIGFHNFSFLRQLRADCLASPLNAPGYFFHGIIHINGPFTGLHICRYWAATTYWSLLMSLFTVVLNVSAIWTAIFGAAMDYMISAPAHGAVIGAWLGAWPMPLDWERPWQEWPISVTYGSVAGHLIGMAISLALIVAHKRRGRAKAD